MNNEKPGGTILSQLIKRKQIYSIFKNNFMTLSQYLPENMKNVYCYKNQFLNGKNANLMPHRPCHILYISGFSE